MKNYKNNQVNEPEDCETIDIRISESKYPVIFARKVKELVDCGMSYDEARNIVEGMVITLELMYSIDHGLYAIESEAIGSNLTALHNPYTGENLTEYEEEEDEGKSEYLEGEADTRTGEIFDNYHM